MSVHFVALFSIVELLRNDSSFTQVVEQKCCLFIITKPDVKNLMATKLAYVFFGVDKLIHERRIIEDVSYEVGTSGNRGILSSPAYHCKKCRRVVALQENSVDHVPGESQTSFGWHKKKAATLSTTVMRLSAHPSFVEALRWMTTAKLTWITSIIGQASNAVVVAARSPQTFSSIKAELTSAVSDIFEAEEHLFIGNIGDTAEVLQNGSKEITHILSILSSASISFFSEWRSGLSIPTEKICKVYAGDSELEDVSSDSSKSSLSPEKLLYLLEYAGNDLKLVRMAVPPRDTENENLLDYLDVCLDFIDKSRKEGSVLVHCFAGVSRSAAIITAYLMRTKQLSQEDALEFLQKSCEFVCANDGFLEQLIVDSTYFLLALAAKNVRRNGFQGDSYNRGERIDTSKFGADPGLPTEEASSDIGTSGNSGRVSTAAYRCKKCRRVVALQENIVDHVLGEGETSFGWHKRKGGNPFNKCDEIECSSIFVEPLRWMTTGVEMDKQAMKSGQSLEYLGPHLILMGISNRILKKVHWRASFYVYIVKLAWITSTGQASNAVVVTGSPQPFSSIKAELTLALSDIFQHRRVLAGAVAAGAKPSVYV
ncbi:hypothetical protein TEA_027836 [Camellia sinensis var. sinensis]|uniref:protein-tyrosine-phosphatase n=1 Tax=Camellia sinensis var. sinensis TaxID=542762 RepID=A0A4S4D229_CAMSN|nr:hypothetical protein TEA_027836 [Camellia sinensis var. sinensis]